MMGRTELGSEFWQAERGGVFHLEGQLYLSGRAALAAILEHLYASGVRSACLPDYCCESMIEPFVRLGFTIGFYSVLHKDGTLQLALDMTDGYDVVFLVDYFGFMAEAMPKLIAACHRKKQKVLLDRTHDLFAAMPQNGGADYTFGSVRKWTGVDAGFAVCADGSALPDWSLTEAGSRYLALRKQARACKHGFVQTGYTDETARQQQLSQFGCAEELLDASYCSATDDENRAMLAELDADAICRRRAANADIIYDYLQRIDVCCPMFRECADHTAPLFVPVLARQGMRDALRTVLRENGVFCPVHWPLSAMHRAGDGAASIYNNELSLICDQRYSEADMIRMMETILLWQKHKSE